MRKKYFWTAAFISLFALHCEKLTNLPPNGKDMGHLVQTKTFTSEIVEKWIQLEVDLMKAAPTAFGNASFSRHYAYFGIALYEAVVPGMPAYRSLAGQLDGLNGLPDTEPGKAYQWEACANATLAEMCRKFFPAASDANKAFINELEASQLNSFSASTDPAIIDRSVKFGKEIAAKIYDWSETDGYKNANNPFTPPADKTGPAFWAPPAAPSIQSLPYWSQVRRMVPGSDAGASLPPPPAYSTQPGSAFYNMVKEVYDASPAPGSPERAMAFYWRDVPGTTTPGHYLSILNQVLQTNKVSLDQAALAYAMAGIMTYDASISTWKNKYQYMLVRPITYIQNVMGFTTWSPTLNTPPHPEYPSAHASLSAANAEGLTEVFGDNHPFEDHTFDYLYNEATDPLLFKFRSFPSFRAFAEDAGWSRLYAGIHYRPSIENGLLQGRTVAENIKRKLHFRK